MNLKARFLVPVLGAAAALAAWGATATSAQAYAPRPLLTVNDANPRTNATTTSVTGYDVSWPQCGSSLPSDGAFGIIGVTDGKPWSTNPCLVSEWSWATGKAQPAHFYMNTADPGAISTHWNKGAHPKPCLSPNSKSATGCAYDYGWNAAADALQRAESATSIAAATGHPWWLDVETGNSWNLSAAANAADVQGSVDYLRQAGIATVGVYSTRTQWGQITGGYSLGSATLDWVAGAASETGAQSMCSSTYAFSGGPVKFTQWVQNNLDNDYSCF